MAEKVFLLHGLARTSKSMEKLEQQLSVAGYSVSNIDYPSRKHAIETLSKFVKKEIDQKRGESETVHVVTHSMGGIILRHIQKTNPIEGLGRVVMLSPPNQGSEVVDKLCGFKPFKMLNGPAGPQLGTAPEGFIRSLGPVDFELGVITGDRSINLILSSMIPGKDDGKVSIESAKVEGMKEFRIIRATHPFIMKNKQATKATISFLKSGAFDLK